MKIMLFRDGEPGEVVVLPGEHPLQEIGELIGGEVRTPLGKLTNRLKLCVVGPGPDKKKARKSGPAAGMVEVLPIKYTYREIFGAETLIYGDCAVVRVGVDGRLLDLSREDEEFIRESIKGFGGRNI